MRLPFVALFWLLCSVTACTDLTSGAQHRSISSNRHADSKAPPLNTKAPQKKTKKAPKPALRKEGKQGTFSQILIAYRGAAGAGEKVKRDKASARVLASRVRNRAKYESFEKLVRAYSDDPMTKNRGGHMGTLKPSAVAPAFTRVAFQLRPGKVGDLVETAFGFHIVKRER